MRKRGLRQEEHPEDVGLECPLQLLFGDVADVFVIMLLARIIDEDVELPELFDRLLHGSLAELLVPDISRDGDGVAAYLLDDLF